jgi:Cu+-exporting ATPase
MLPVLIVAMVPPLQFDHWQWLALTLASLRRCLGRAALQRAAWANARHATATMDTLVSVGVLAAFAWSLYALFLGDAGDPGMTMGFELIPDRPARTHDLPRGRRAS